MPGNTGVRFEGMDDLLDALDRKGRILVEQVLEGDDGEPVRELWIARIGKPHHRLKTIDPDLFGPVVVSPDLVRGPLPNAWSHRNRLEANHRAVESTTRDAESYLNGTHWVNLVIGIAMLLLFLTVAVKCTIDHQTAPEPEGVRIVQ
jgi:hypothetical protein